MFITAKATVEIKVEVQDALIEQDIDLNDPGTLHDLIEGQNTDKAVAEAFFNANDLIYTCENVPDRCSPEYLSREECFKEMIRRFEEEFAYKKERCGA